MLYGVFGAETVKEKVVPSDGLSNCVELNAFYFDVQGIKDIVELS